MGAWPGCCDMPPVPGAAACCRRSQLPLIMVARLPTLAFLFPTLRTMIWYFAGLLLAALLSGGPASAAAGQQHGRCAHQ